VQHAPQRMETFSRFTQAVQRLKALVRGRKHGALGRNSAGAVKPEAARRDDRVNNHDGELSRYSGRLQAGQQKSRGSSPSSVKVSLLSTASRRLSGQWVKRPGREADHSPPTSAEVKKTWICTSSPP
jgi:hypothetical protein